MPVGGKQTYRFGSFELDTQCGQLRRDGVGLKLQGQPVQILEVLLETPGELVTREQLRDRLWSSDTFVDFDHSLNTAIKRLRQALGDEADTPRYIETLPRRGYRFIGELCPETIPNVNTEPVKEDIVSKVAATMADAAIDAASNSLRHRRIVWWITATIAVLLLSAAAVYWLTKPMPLPRIVASHALTKTRFRKLWGQNLLPTDGVNLYFQEKELSNVKSVNLAGGETSEVQIPWKQALLRDISSGGSGLLFSVYDANSKDFDAWIQPLPPGSARLIVKNARYPVLTPDGRHVIFVRNLDKKVYQVDIDGTQERELVTFPDVSGLAISPDGQQIRVAVAHTASIWQSGSDGLNPHRIFTEHKESVAQGNWSPDGKHYFFQSWDGDRFNLWVASEARWWFGAKTRFRQLTVGPLGYGTPTVSKDGRHLYAVGVEPHGELSVYDQREQRYVPYLKGLSACFVDFSRDGQWIAYVSYPEGTLWRSRIDGSQRRQLTVPPLAAANPRWSPDGTQIAFMDFSGGNRQLLRYKSTIYLVSADGGGPRLLVGGERNAGEPSWSADGMSIAYGSSGSSGPEDREIRIVDLATKTSGKLSGSEGLWAPRWSPDGKYLWARRGLFPMKAYLFTVATQQWKELSTLPVSWPSWSRDSKALYVAQSDGIVRVAIPGGQVEKVAPLPDFPTTAFFFDRWGDGWFGITPDGRPITTRDTGIEEIYAFDLEY